jgi:hypothetical protein
MALRTPLGSPRQAGWIRGPVSIGCEHPSPPLINLMGAGLLPVLPWES